MKSNFATGNRLPKSKNSGNLENFEKNSFEKQKCAMFVFFEKYFQYFPCEVFLISSLESWNQTSLDSWIFLISSHETWTHLLLNLEIKLLLILESSWFILMKLEINLDLELVDSILKPFFGLFVIIFVIIKTTWINLIHHHEACFYKLGISRQKL